MAEAAAPDIAIRHEFVRANGLRFHVAVCGEGPALALCLHGFPECWFSWRHQLPLLARLGYRAWAPDLRGYGESDRPARRESYGIEVLLEDVAGLIDASGAERVALLGHDWGGIVSWYFAMRRVRPLDRLVVLNCPHPGAAEPAFRRLSQLRRSWYALFFQLPWLPDRLLARDRARLVGEIFRRTASDPRRFPDDVLAVYREAASRPGAATAMLHYYRAFLRGGGLRRQRAVGHPRIETPTLLIWGEEDVALGIETTEGTDRFVRDLAFHRLPGVSHWVQQDAPDQVNALLEEWLRKPAAPAAE